MVGSHSMGPGLLACWSLIFEFPSRKAITRVQTSSNVNISRNSNGYISVMRDATVTWLGLLLVIHTYCVCLSDVFAVAADGDGTCFSLTFGTV